MLGKALAVLLGLAAGLAGAGGCDTPFFPSVEVNVPPTVQAVLDDFGAFTAGGDELLATTEPGTVINDLTTLDGCWASVYTGSIVTEGLDLFSVYQFNADERTFTRWSGLATDAGELWPAMPVLAVETGSYTIPNPAVLNFANERYFSNVDPATEQVTSDLIEAQVLEGPIIRPALVTLAGDRMLLYIGAETVADVDSTADRPYYYRFDCPSAEQ